MTRVVGYSRPLDADDQAMDAARLRDAGADQVFVESSAGETTALAECLDSLQPGDVVLVSRASRLSPTQARFLKTVAAIGARGAGFHSLAEPALSTDATVTTAEVYRALEQLRSELAGIQTRVGMKAQRSGRPPGRPKVMTGDRLEIAIELRRAGRSISHISRVLGVSGGAVRRAFAEIEI